MHKKILADRAVSGPFELNALIEVVGGDLSLLAEVAELGAADLSRLLDAIDRAASALELASLAHELKGVLLNLTAAPAAAQVTVVERAARSGDVAAVREELSRVRATLHEIIAALAASAALVRVPS